MVLESDRVSGLPSVSFVVGAASRCLLSVRGFVFVFFNTDTPPLMMPLEIQLQTASPSGAVMICAVGKLLIWKQRVTGDTKYKTKAETELLSPGWLLLSTSQIQLRSTGPTSWRKKKRKLEENTNKASVRLNGRLHHARSNDDRLPGRQKRDTAQIQHVDPICLPCSGEEVVIRHLLSDQLTSQMD